MGHVPNVANCRSRLAGNETELSCAIGIAGAGESDINLTVLVLVALDRLDLVEAAEREIADLDPGSGIVVGSPDPIDAADPAGDENRRVIAAGGRLAETEGVDFAHVWNVPPSLPPVSGAHERDLGGVWPALLPGGEEQVTGFSRHGAQLGVEAGKGKRPAMDVRPSGTAIRRSVDSGCRLRIGRTIIVNIEHPAAHPVGRSNVAVEIIRPTPARFASRRYAWYGHRYPSRPAILGVVRITIVVRHPYEIRRGGTRDAAAQFSGGGQRRLRSKRLPRPSAIS